MGKMAMSAYASGMYGFYSPYDRGLQQFAPFTQLAGPPASSSVAASFGAATSAIGGAGGSQGGPAQLLALG